MSFFKRLSSYITIWSNNFLDKIEPSVEIKLKSQITSFKEDVVKLVDSVAGVKAQTKQFERNIANLGTKIAHMDTSANLAFEKSLKLREQGKEEESNEFEEDARQYIEQKILMEQELEGYENALKENKKVEAELLSKVDEYTYKVKELEARKNIIVAQLQVAETRAKLTGNVMNPNTIEGTMTEAQFLIDKETSKSEINERLSGEKQMQKSLRMDRRSRIDNEFEKLKSNHLQLKASVETENKVLSSSNK